MNEQEYLSERVDDQINWYDKKSKTNQKWFKRFKVIEIILSASLSLFAVVFHDDCIKYISVIIGLLLTIIAGFSSINKFQENWIQYRTTAEVLKQEKYLYLTRSGPYNEQNSFQLFVERIENSISKETSIWSQYVIKDIKQGEKNG
jgi:hypothetical protein